MITGCEIRRRRFARRFALHLNATVAAREAGYRAAEKAGRRCLADPRVQVLIAEAEAEHRRAHDVERRAVGDHLHAEAVVAVLPALGVEVDGVLRWRRTADVADPGLVTRTDDRGAVVGVLTDTLDEIARQGVAGAPVALAERLPRLAAASVLPGPGSAPDGPPVPLHEYLAFDAVDGGRVLGRFRHLDELTSAARGHALAIDVAPDGVNVVGVHLPDPIASMFRTRVTAGLDEESAFAAGEIADRDDGEVDKAPPPAPRVERSGLAADGDDDDGDGEAERLNFDALREYRARLKRRDHEERSRCAPAPTVDLDELEREIDAVIAAAAEVTEATQIDAAHHATDFGVERTR